MLNYGLRVGELMLLTVNSIKKSVLNDSYSLIITNTDDEHDDRRRKPKIKNEFSYRVITLQERDYRFINIYIKKMTSRHLIDYSLALSLFHVLRHDLFQFDVYHEVLYPELMRFQA